MLPLKYKKNADEFSAWFNEIVFKAEIVDARSPVKGCNVLLPNGYEIWENIKRIVDVKFKRTGHKNAYFPLLIPEEFLVREAEHFEGFVPEVLFATQAGNKPLERKLAIRPTSETIMYYMYSLWIRSHADLPLKYNQWCNIIRWDTKMTKPLLRDREFLWSEGHTCHATLEEADEQVKESMDIYSSTFDELCLSYLVLRRPPHDTFAGANYSIAYDCPLPDGKVLQIGTTHNLGQGFAKVFDIAFTKEDGSRGFVYQTCYGLSTRLIAAILSVHGDDQGLIIPPIVSPVQVVIIPIVKKKDKDAVIKKSMELADILTSAGFRAYLDDRDQYRPGWKYNEYEMRGVPLRIEIGSRDIENNGFVVVRRDKKGKIFVSKNEAIKKIGDLLDQINEDLVSRAKELLEQNIREATTYSDLLNIMKTSRGFVRTTWCGSEDCADKIKDDMKAEIRGIRNDINEKPEHDCVVCGNKAESVVYVAMSY
ncbi:MAG: proline--tRNA ligase [Candidatus Hodarchaeales archaeon]